MNWKNKNVLITGGAGFIGSNLTNHLLKEGAVVTILDNFSRQNVTKNIDWLKSHYPNLSVLEADIREISKIEKTVVNKDVVFHEAAQVAVTDSVADPVSDFEINARGSLNVLESIRKHNPEAIAVYASTNKVYGGLEHFPVGEQDERYVFTDESLLQGVSEGTNLDFHSPYGCSKGTADQYFVDYGRIYDMKTLVFRQSCIYGPRQWGTEDQGWIFHFLKLAYQKQPIKIFGNGKQVRDLLYIDDLINAYEMAISDIDNTFGQAYNVGGGLANSVSLLEAIQMISELLGHEVETKFFDPRPGDQKVFISDNTKAKDNFGWAPKVDVPTGLEKMLEWVRESQSAV